MRVTSLSPPEIRLLDRPAGIECEDAPGPHEDEPLDRLPRPVRGTGAVWRFKRNSPEDTITDVMEDGGWGNLGTVQKYCVLRDT